MVVVELLAEEATKQDAVRALVLLGPIDMHCSYVQVLESNALQSFHTAPVATHEHEIYNNHLHLQDHNTDLSRPFSVHSLYFVLFLPLNRDSTASLQNSFLALFFD